MIYLLSVIGIALYSAAIYSLITTHTSDDSDKKDNHDGRTR